MPPDLALQLTLISSNYPCLEHICIVPKVRAIEVLLYLRNLLSYDLKDAFYYLEVEREREREREREVQAIEVLLYLRNVLSYALKDSFYYLEVERERERGSSH